MLQVDFHILNQKGTPAFYAGALANRPAAGFAGRIFVDTDNPSTGMYRDTGTAWVQISSGSGGSQDLQSVCNNGYSTDTDMTFLYEQSLNTSTISFYNQDVGDYTFDIVKDQLEKFKIIAYKASGVDEEMELIFDAPGNTIKTRYNSIDQGLKFDFFNQNYLIGRDFQQATNQYGYLGISQYGGLDALQYILTIKDSAEFQKTFVQQYNPEETFLQQIISTDNLFYSNFNQGLSSLTWQVVDNDNSYTSNIYLGSNIFTCTSINSDTSESLGLELNIADNVIKTKQNGGTAGLQINFGTDVTTLANSTCGLKMSANRVSTSDAAGVDEFGMRVAYATQIELGDFAGVGNGTKFVVNDVNQRVEFSTNLRSSTAGGNSGQHLKVRVAGVDYKITLLNP
jgi:hypothetical protein